MLVSIISLAFAIPSTLIAILELRKRRRVERELTGGRAVRFAVETDDSRRELYKVVIASVDAARGEILKIGRGVSRFDDPQDQTISSYVQAEERALARGVLLRRIQTSAHVSGQWPAAFAALVRRYPDQVRVVADFADRSYFSGAVIDPDGENPIVELLFDTPRPHLDGDRFLASNVVVIYGNRPLARAVRDMFVQRFRGLPALSASDIEAIGFDHFYFAYGANLDGETMRQRAPSAKALGVGYLDNWTLAFGTEGSHLEGGGAAILPQGGARVWGVIYAISRDDKRRLDETEKDAYDPVTLSVCAREGGGPYEACIYMPRVGRSNGFAPSAPDPSYLERMLSAARHWEMEPLIDELLRAAGDRQFGER